MINERWIWSFDQMIPSEVGADRRVIDLVVNQLLRHEWLERDIFGIHLALEEAIVNAIRHGNQLDDNKQVYVCCKLSSSRFWIEVRDEGSGFDLEDVPDPTVEENLEVASGRGVLLMQNYMNRVEYNEVGNCVIMEKMRSETS